jgi:hypothetical protein
MHTNQYGETYIDCINAFYYTSYTNCNYIGNHYLNLRERKGITLRLAIKLSIHELIVYKKDKLRQ